jgi:hypothetical protein
MHSCLGFQPSWVVLQRQPDACLRRYARIDGDQAQGTAEMVAKYQCDIRFLIRWPHRRRLASPEVIVGSSDFAVASTELGSQENTAHAIRRNADGV